MTPSPLRPKPGVPVLAGEPLAIRASHDLNNIFAALQAQSELLSSGLDLPESARGPAENIITCVRRGAELSGKIGGLVRTCQLGPAPTDLNHFLPGATAFMARQLAGSGTVQYLHPEGNTLWAVIDEEALRQAFYFLALNARDAVRTGAEITLRLSSAASALGQCACDQNMACIAMTDSRAVGLAAEQLAYCNGHPATCEFAKGLDLGLAAARRIITRHGGCMMAENMQPTGVRFQICLPLATPQSSTGPSMASVSNVDSTAASPAKQHVLVVDDEDMVRSVIRTALTLRGYKITEAGSGCEALDKFQRFDSPIDLVLMDIGLPDMDGWTVLEMMRNIRPNAPVVMISGSTAEEQPLKYAQDAGVQFLGKPYANADLLSAVRKALSRNTKPSA